MAHNPKEILQYVGDDGEFLYPIDEVGVFSGEQFIYPAPNTLYQGSVLRQNPLVWAIIIGLISVVVVGLGIAYLFPGDATWLQLHRDEILAASYLPKPAVCHVSPIDSIETITFYTITKTDIYESGEIQVNGDAVEIYRPDKDAEWYKLADTTYTGQGIVLAKYFDNMVCEDV